MPDSRNSRCFCPFGLVGINTAQLPQPVSRRASTTRTGAYENPLPRYGGGLGRGKPHFGWLDSSRASPSLPSPNLGEGRWSCENRLTRAGESTRHPLLEQAVEEAGLLLELDPGVDPVQP